MLASAAVAAFGFAPPAFSDPAPPDAKLAPDVAWVVIGVQPATARLEIDEPRLSHGLIGKGVVLSFRYSLDAYEPVDGFILFKARPDTLYAVAAPSMMAGKTIFGIRYKPCGQIPAFQAAGGKVVYFTSYDFRSEGTVRRGLGEEFLLGASQTQDLEGARAFLKTHYPNLSYSLEQGQQTELTALRQCR